MRLGVFDSGIGGLTVLGKLIPKFPQAKWVYLGDTANVPYGSKTPTTIKKLCKHAAALLKPQRLDALIVACNTVSAVALEDLRNWMHPVPVLGVVEPGARVAVQASGKLSKAPIVILATKATVSSSAYLKAIHEIDSTLRVIQIACPLLVPLIEEGWIRHPTMDAALESYTSAIPRKGRGVAVLGCTHYPWAANTIQRHFFKFGHWRVVEGTTALATELKTLLGPRTALKTRKSKNPSIEWVFTDTQALSPFALKQIALLENN